MVDDRKVASRQAEIGEDKWTVDTILFRGGKFVQKWRKKTYLVTNAKQHICSETWNVFAPKCEEKNHICSEMQTKTIFFRNVGKNNKYFLRNENKEKNCSEMEKNIFAQK